MFRTAIFALPLILSPALGMASTTNNLLAQPMVVGGLASIFSVATVLPVINPVSQFFIKQNQDVVNGQRDVPTGWAAGNRTGFFPHGTPLPNWQIGVPNSHGDPTGNEVTQGEGDTIGAYITSAAFPHGTHLNKVMVAPQYNFDLQNPTFPFRTPASLLTTNFDLQVPYAHNNPRIPEHHPFVVSDITTAEIDGHGNTFNRVTLHASAFSSGQGGGNEGIMYDAATNSVIISGVIRPASIYLNQLPGSATFSGSPWTGFRHFGFTQDTSQFARGLADAHKIFPQLSTNPADYVLVQWHLNAELTYDNSDLNLPIDMGWSLRGIRVDLTQ